MEVVCKQICCVVHAILFYQRWLNPFKFHGSLMVHVFCIWTEKTAFAMDKCKLTQENSASGISN